MFPLDWVHDISRGDSEFQDYVSEDQIPDAMKKTFLPFEVSIGQFIMMLQTSLKKKKKCKNYIESVIGSTPKFQKNSKNMFWSVC